MFSVGFQQFHNSIEDQLLIVHNRSRKNGSKATNNTLSVSRKAKREQNHNNIPSKHISGGKMQYLLLIRLFEK